MTTLFKSIVALSLFFIVTSGFAEQKPFYCPQKHGYIRIGMSESEVLAACGQPSSQEKSKQAAVEQVPVMQLIYTTLNPDPVYRGYKYVYSMWSLPVGSSGSSLEVDVVNKKITAIRFNGENTNASSVCSNRSFSVGDPADKVFTACGNPSLVNRTFQNQKIKSKNKPVTWIYSSDPYQPTFRLIFLDGTLRAIE